jgi:lipid-A-disaccharide synthase
VAPELIQDELTPTRLAEEAMQLLVDGQIRAGALEKLKAVKRALGDAGASERTARIAVSMIDRQLIPRDLER